MLYQVSLENADGVEVLSWFKAESSNAFRIADAMSAYVNEPLAMLCVADHGEPHAYPCSWIVGAPTAPQVGDSWRETEIKLNARRSAFLVKVNDVYERELRGA